jgi:hypothetical protein
MTAAVHLHLSVCPVILQQVFETHHNQGITPQQQQQQHCCCQ